MALYELSYSQKKEIDEWMHEDIHVEGFYSSKELAQQRLYKLIELKIVDPTIFNFQVSEIIVDSPEIGTQYGDILPENTGYTFRSNHLDIRVAE